MGVMESHAGRLGAVLERSICQRTKGVHMFPVYCSTCGFRLANVAISACPQCGSIFKRVELSARSSGMMTGRAQISWRKVEKTIERDWMFVALLGLILIMSGFVSYFTTGWLSVACTLFFFVSGTLCGFYAAMRVDTVTTGGS